MRGKWLILGSVAFSAALAWSYCVLAPQYYRSETLIIAEEQNRLDNVVKGAGEGNFEQQLFVIQRQILSPDFLGEIVREFNPYPDALEEGGETFAALTLAGAIKVERIKTDLAGNLIGGNGIEAFVVSFMHGNPKTAMQVTARIAGKFIEENTKGREHELRAN